MIEVHVYGHLKKKFDPKARLSENTVLRIPHVENERFSDLLKRLELSRSDHGECFVNHTVVTDHDETTVPDGSRVAIFSHGMFLLDGGQHLKGHGYITKNPPRKIDYF